MPTKVVSLLLIGSVFLWLTSCAGRFVTTNERVLSEADSLFSAGDYVHAKLAYTAVTAAHPNTESAEEAQFKLGYINVYYSNPFGDWKAALREFSKYQSQYPKGRKIEEVNSWINMLHNLQSYEDGYSSSNSQARDLKSKSLDDLRKTSSLAEALLRCEGIKDSLNRQIDGLNTSIKLRDELINQLQRMK